MQKGRPISTVCMAVLVSLVGSLALVAHESDPGVGGTIWVANRAAHTVRAFEARTGAIVHTVAMAANSQPGDLAHANGKIYVAEEFGAPPAIAVIDADTGIIVHRIVLPAGSRPHHVHASPGGRLVAVGLFGTDLVAVLDAHDDAVVGVWDSNPATTSGRVHSAVFSPDGRTLYLASDATNEVIAIDPQTGHIWWRMAVPAAHELAVAHDGKSAYVSRRSAHKLAVIDLENQTYQDVLTLGLPDTLRLSANEQILTVGLRTAPAQVAVVDTRSFQFELVTLSAPGETATIAGHQSTSRSGRYTFAAFEGGANPGVAVIDHHAGNIVVQRLVYPGRPHGVDRAGGDVPFVQAAR